MTKIKLIVLGSFLAFLGLFYLGSIYVAYNKGYNKHVLETLKKASEVVLGSHNDILVAAQKVKDKEKDIIGIVPSWAMKYRKTITKIFF